MFKKILIANRGEIALRITRTCRRLGVAVVAVYSAAEADAPHVAAADETVCIGGAPVGESYLCGERIVAAARATGAEAVHPGYGLLSENPAFALAVGEAGLVWIGPAPAAIAAMGNKLAARELMAKAGIPVLPGSRERIVDAEDIAARLGEIGFPLIVKASEGGGGIGMQVVRSAEQLKNAIKRTRSTAGRAFGSDEVYVERFLDGARHVEIQVLGGGNGEVLHLFERECSIQRRNQKVIEETPSPALSPALRQRMTETAVAAAKAIRYSNAGTIECLVDSAGDFYFLEMNTRLQVEHPITEVTTGVDLVEQQLRVASGEGIAFTQADLVQRGHAIECRIYAEDPQSFLPSPGTLRVFRPPTGEGIRVDAGVAEGGEVSLYYDPLLAKLIAHGSSRTETIARAMRALIAFQVDGVKTNLPFLIGVLRSQAFSTGVYDIGSISQAQLARAPL